VKGGKRKVNDKIRYLREQVKRLNLEGMIVSNPVNVRYLTNIDCDAGTLLITRKENIYITNAMYIDEINNVLTINDEIVVVDFKDITKDEFENFFLFCEKVGFEEGYVTYEEYGKIKQKFKINELVETEKIIEKQRMIKDEDEIKKIKTACEITDECFSHLLTFIKKGMTEKQVALEIENFFKLNGADGVAFEIVVATGVNSAIPHWKPSDKKIATADPILIDMGCNYKGYCSDMSRTIFMGCILEEIKPFYDFILKNQTNINRDVRDNASIKTIATMVENNYESNRIKLIHSLGHGVGLETHEIPFMTQKNEGILKENMVITTEPRIIYSI